VPHFVTTTIVTPDRIADFLAPRTDVLVERLDRINRIDHIDHLDPVDGPHAVDPADPDVARAAVVAGGSVGFTVDHGPFRHYRRSVSIGPVVPVPGGADLEGADPGVDDAAARIEVRQELEYSIAVPVWGFLFAAPVRGVLRGPNRPVRPWWLPPDQLTAAAATTLSFLCVFAALAGYLGTLLTQTNTFFKEEFGVDDGQVGVMLAAVRVGALFALVIVAAADRRGRRRVLLWSALVGCVVTATGALAPNLVTLGVSQTAARSFSTALVLVISIIAVEEMPAGSRAFAVSVLTATGALGAGFAVMLVSVAGLGPAAWRILYLVPLAALPVVVRFGRQIPETRRFAAAADRRHDHRHDHRRRPGPSLRLPAGIDRGRLLLLSASGLALSLFVLPASSFLNEYLRTERGFSAGTITMFQILTNTPGGLGIVVGGKLADRRGRRVIGAVGVGAGAAFTVGMYLTGGWSIWMCSLLGSVLGAMAVPALGVYGPELFPTAARGAANGIINLAAVAGSAIGLVLAGHLSDHFGSLGPAMALLSTGAVVVVLLVLVCYPETAALELEDLNPHDAPLARELFALDGLDPDLQVERFPFGADEGPDAPPPAAGEPAGPDPDDPSAGR
jgi:MFS family permease